MRFAMLLLCACSGPASTDLPALLGADAVAPAPDASMPACTTLPATSETVTLVNPYGHLEGTLVVPAHCGAIPAVVILHGSGSLDRDGNYPGQAGGISLYKSIGDAISGQGYATLRYDDHGIAGSTTGAPARVEDFRIEDQTRDAANWVAQLRGDARFSKVIFAGHSEGSLTAILASQQHAVDAIVSLAGAGRPLAQIIHDQFAGQLTQAQLTALDAATAQLTTGVMPGALPPPLDQVLPVDQQPYLASWAKYDPSAEIAKTAMPVILIQGTTDTQVKVKDANLLHAARPDTQLAIIFGMCHVLKTAAADSASQKKAYSDPTVPLADALTPDIANFLGPAQAP